MEGDFLTFSQMAEQIIIQEFPGAKQAKFKKAVENHLYKALPEDERCWIEEYMGDVRFIPDVYRIINNDIEIYEVEDTNLLTTKKINLIATLYDNLIPFDIEVKLFIVNRYGMITQQINLGQFFVLTNIKKHAQ